MNRRVRALFLGVLALGIADQVVQHGLLGTGYFRGVRVAPFDPPLFAPHQVERIASYRSLAASGIDPRRDSDFDAELGWSPRPSTSDGMYSFDDRGARIGFAAVPHERTALVRRVVALGCSFTFGQEVDGTSTWVARVDEARPDLEVVNFAFGSYGIDQALLRFRRDGIREKPDEVWLGILPPALTRLVSVYVPAQRHWTGVVFVKPRFELDSRGELALSPNPARSLSELVELITDQELFRTRVGERDAFVQRWPSAYEVLGSRAWHHSAFARLTVTSLERGGRDAKPAVLDPDSAVRRLALAIVRDLARDVSASGAKLRLLILPDRLDLTDRAENSGVAYWDGFVADLTRAGLEGIDLGPAFAAVSAQGDDRYWAPEGHYSAEGNAIVAQAFLDSISRSQ